jgi:hypothetical protein
MEKISCGTELLLRKEPQRKFPPTVKRLAGILTVEHAALSRNFIYTKHQNLTKTIRVSALQDHGTLSKPISKQQKKRSDHIRNRISLQWQTHE